MASDVVGGHRRYTLVGGDVPMMHLHSSLKGATVVALVLGLVVMATCLPAAAVTYDITQSAVKLGSITPFSGTQTAAAFYDYGGPHTYSGGPAGVPLGGSTSVLYVYLDQNTGDHSLGWIHGKDGATPPSPCSGRMASTVPAAGATTWHLPAVKTGWSTRPPCE